MSEQIAIVGMAVVLPGADSLETYWQNLVHGVDAITEAPAGRWDEEFHDTDAVGRPDRVYCRRGGFIDQSLEFDPLAFGIMPTSVRDIEPDHLIALRTAAAAIDDAGGIARMPALDRIGVILGRGAHTTGGQANYLMRVRWASSGRQLVRDLLPDLPPDRLDAVRDAINAGFGPYQGDAAIGLIPNLAASRIANRLNLRGPAYTLDAACASSLIAVDHGIGELVRNRLDAVLVGGVHHTQEMFFWSIFNQLGALSRRGRIRPFDAGADGLLMGEGTGIIVLKRLRDAIRNEDRIHAVIRGIGVSSDGRSASLVNPESSGQVLAVRRAWASAELDPTAPGALGLLEAHGTGTPTGDATELRTLTEVFGTARSSDSAARPVIGSVKSMIGHAMPAAGIAGLIKAVLAVSHATLLPTLHCDNPRSELERTRFAPIGAARHWETDGTRRAGVNAFGFGGINAHVIVEEFRSRPATSPSATRQPSVSRVAVEEPERVLLLSAPDQEALSRLLDADEATVREQGSAWTTHCQPIPAGAGCRLAIVGPTPGRLAVAQTIVAAGKPWSRGRDIWFSPRPLLAGGGRLAFVFPGLGADFTPRVGDIAAHFDLPVDDLSDTGLRSRMIGGVRVGRLLHDALGRIGVVPDLVAGHSHGEWTASFVAGTAVLDLEEFAAVLEGQDLERQGMLTAVIGIDARTVQAALPRFSGVLLSHDNAPTQSVVCGPAEQVSSLVEEFRANRTLCQLLPFSGGFHTSYLEPVLRPLREAVHDWQHEPARFPIWSATLAGPAPTDPRAERDLFFQHLLEPVRFTQTVSAMYDSGVRVFLQMGPGQLAGLITENLRGREHVAVPVNVGHRTGLAQLRRVAAALWVEGSPVDLAALSAPEVKAAPVSSRPIRISFPFPPATAGLGAGAAGLLGDADSVVTAPVAQLSTSSGLEAEFAALWEETVSSARAVLTAVARAQRPAAEPAPARSIQAEPSEEAQEFSSILHISVEDMPYLRDHCFFPQPANWPFLADRFPVVPATTLIHHMMDAVQRVVPGRPVVEVVNARFSKWLQADPERDVEIGVRAVGNDRFTVTVKGFAQATLETADRYPLPPAAWPAQPGTEQRAIIDADTMYAERHLFHGPRFQGVQAVHAIGERHARGTIRCLPAPGALLDATLHLVDNWAKSSLTQQNVTFPVEFGSIRFYGPAPRPGDEFAVSARVVTIAASRIVHEHQFVRHGQVWAVLEDVVGRRFDSHPKLRMVNCFPGTGALSECQPEGWVAAFGRWGDLRTQEFLARQVLGTQGYEEYLNQPVDQRKSWLMSRIAVQDSVRFRLWGSGRAEVFPIEVRVRDRPDALAGRASVVGWPWSDVPAADASYAHAGDVAVAMSRSAGAGAGVDAHAGLGIHVSELRHRPDSELHKLFSATELALIDQLAADRPTDRTLWSARLTAAKMATAKAENTELGLRPDRFIVVPQTAAAAEVVVTTARRSHRVAFREISNPEGLPQRRYSVAWTEANESTPRTEITS